MSQITIAIMVMLAYNATINRWRCKRQAHWPDRIKVLALNGGVILKKRPMFRTAEGKFVIADHVIAFTPDGNGTKVFRSPIPDHEHDEVFVRLVVAPVEVLGQFRAYEFYQVKEAGTHKVYYLRRSAITEIRPILRMNPGPPDTSTVFLSGGFSIHLDQSSEEAMNALGFYEAPCGHEDSGPAPGVGKLCYLCGHDITCLNPAGKG